MLPAVGCYRTGSNDFPHLSIEELIFIVWEAYRGEERWGKPQSVNHCFSCRKEIEWAVDLLWLRWNHDSYEPFGSFIN